MILFLTLLLVTGCATKPASAPQSTTPVVTPPTVISSPPITPPAPPIGPFTEADLVATGSPTHLPPEELGAWLSHVANQGKEPLLPWLQAVVKYWYPGRTMRLLEADLDGENTQEVVLALNGVEGRLTGRGGLFVVYRKEGKYFVDERLNPDEDRSTIAVLNEVADLTGDGRPEIIWSTAGQGAHTAYATVHLSQWRPGHLVQLPGVKMFITNMSLKTEGLDLLLSGGGVASAGAGLTQRGWTDRYRWVDGAFAHVDRVFMPSEFSYHRLQDGIMAEEYHRLADAKIAFTEAMEPGRIDLHEHAFFPPDNLKPAQFAEAVRAMARFRLGALLLEDPATTAEARKLLQEATGPFAGLAKALRDGTTRLQGCNAAVTWASNHPELLVALNSPFGYANPTWQPSDLCGPLPPHRN
jgi:hypothetical protein